MFSKQHGFSLIELLIVITIVGILASFSIFTFAKYPARARDARRKADLIQIKKALEEAKNDCLAGTYPVYNANQLLSLRSRYENMLAPYLTSPNLGYLKSILLDPKSNTTYYYGFDYDSTQNTANACPSTVSGTPPNIIGTATYRLVARLEDTQDADIAASIAKCPPDAAKFKKLDTTYPSYNTSGVPLYVVCPD